MRFDDSAVHFLTMCSFLSQMLYVLDVIFRQIWT